MSERASKFDIPLPRFLNHLEESEVFSADDFVKHRATLTRLRDVPTGIEELINSQVLTRYQAEAIAGGHFERLRAGNYEILSQLGAGGMGAVFKARHRRMKRIVALKLLSPEIAEESSFVHRFQREVETIAQLAHPNIVMAYDADEAEIGHFLVMEFVNGRDLSSEIEENGPLSVEETVEYISQAAAGLEYAHSKGIIHRDIKPANLMLTADRSIKVADLGLARLTAGTTEGKKGYSSITQAGGILGTVDFMPPEQAVDSTAIDHRVDIYSLGCTLYFLLTGRPPYVAGSLMGLMLQHREAKIPDLRAAVPEAPLALVSAFERMVAKKVDDRPASMTDVIRLMEAIKPLVKGLTSRPVPSEGALAASGNMFPDTTISGAGSSLVGSNALRADGANPSLSDARRLAELVLVLVEPSRTQGTIFRSYLTNLGLHNVHSTGSGAQALALVKLHRANAIISTMHLSDMTAVQLATQLRQDPECAGAGFVLMTSEADTSQAAAVQSHARSVLLIKPFDLKQLAQAIAAATGRTTETLTSPS